MSKDIFSSTDSRPCQEKIQGPLHEDGQTRHILHSPANKNNEVTICCRVICQEADAVYSPLLRILLTENGNFYEQNWHGAEGLFEVVSPRDSSNNMFVCNPANNIAEYEFQVTVQSPLANRSIAICGLFYQSVSETLFSEYCYTDRVAWITYDDNNTDGATTTSNVPPTISTSEEHCACTSTLQPSVTEPRDGGGKVSLAVTVIIAVISFATGVLLIRVQ